jgi:Tfp pilus assembly protein PilX
LEDATHPSGSAAGIVIGVVVVVLVVLGVLSLMGKRVVVSE